MTNLGYRLVNGLSIEKDLLPGTCWLMRAALLDRVEAQEKLSFVFAGGEKDGHGIVIPADLVQADFWFRLAARNPFHDNPQIRSRIEPNMTTAQLNEAKRQVEAWQPKTIQDLKTLAIALPPPGPGAPGRACPPMP